MSCKPYDAIFFDLDGTLLPMDQDAFVQAYFHQLASIAVKHGYDPSKFLNALIQSVGAMIQNDGSKLNEKVFWDAFVGFLGEGILNMESELDDYYSGAFREIVTYTMPNPDAAEMLRLAREKADKVVLATNPLFPPGAIVTRLGWIGLKMDDFDHVTVYTNSRYCKPNPAYFGDLLDMHDLKDKRVLMVGNDLREDTAALKVGAEIYLITDCLIAHGLEMGDTRHGTRAEFVDWLKKV